MLKLLLILLFIIKLYVRINVFTFIKKRDGQNIIKAACNFEKVKTK